MELNRVTVDGFAANHSQTHKRQPTMGENKPILGQEGVDQQALTYFTEASTDITHNEFRRRPFLEDQEKDDYLEQLEKFKSSYENYKSNPSGSDMQGGSSFIREYCELLFINPINYPVIEGIDFNIEDIIAPHIEQTIINIINRSEIFKELRTGHFESNIIKNKVGKLEFIFKTLWYLSNYKIFNRFMPYDRQTKARLRAYYYYLSNIIKQVFELIIEVNNNNTVNINNKSYTEKIDFLMKDLFKLKSALSKIDNIEENKEHLKLAQASIYGGFASGILFGSSILYQIISWYKKNSTGEEFEYNTTFIVSLFVSGGLLFISVLNNFLIYPSLYGPSQHRQNIISRLSNLRNYTEELLNMVQEVQQHQTNRALNNHNV